MSGAVQLSEREMEVLSLALQCLKGDVQLQIDYQKLSELAGFKTAGSANASWLVIKKKLAGGVNAPEASSSKGDDTTPAKAKATPKKRGTKAKAGAEADGGAAADDEQSPTTSPKKAAAIKRKAPADADDNDANGDAAEETPAKKPRGRKPKDPNAPPPKPRAKKATKASAIKEEPAIDSDAANAQLLDEAGEEEGVQPSIFGGDIKAEENDEDRPFTEEEQKYVNEKLADDKLFGVHTNGEEAV